MFILLVYTVKICHNIYHFIISRTKVEKKKKQPRKLTSLKGVFFFFFPCNLRVRRVGRYVLGMWMVLLLKRLLRAVCEVTEEARVRRTKAVSLSGWKSGAQVHSLPEPRQGVSGLCWETGPRRRLPLPRLSGRQPALAKPRSPTLGSEPQLHWGQPPWRVWLGSEGGRREPQLQGSHGRVWLLILLPWKEIVLRGTAPASLMPLTHSGTPRGPAGMSLKGEHTSVST